MMDIIDEFNKEVTITAINDLLELEIVQQDYMNEWLNLEDYYSLLENYNNFPDLEDYSLFFQSDEKDIRVIIARDYIGDRGDDTEMYHYFIKEDNISYNKVELYYQSHNGVSPTFPTKHPLRIKINSNLSLLFSNNIEKVLNP